MWDQILLSSFLKTLPNDVHVFIQERSPSTKAAMLADNYFQVREEEQANKDPIVKGDKSIIMTSQLWKGAGV